MVFPVKDDRYCIFFCVHDIPAKPKNPEIQRFFKKMFVFITGVGIHPPVEFGVRICSDMHFWGSCGVLKVAMAQLEMPCRVF